MLEILHNDNDCVAVNKPAGLATIPGRAETTSVLEELAAQLGLPCTGTADPRIRVVHRLDKDTSGVLLFAKHVEAQRALSHQFQNNFAQKEYLAIVYGKMVAGGKVDAAIGRHMHDRLKQAVREDGRDAVTHYRVRERFRSMTLIECRLETGRTHQIRVHMAHARHPLVGDTQYGGLLKLPKGASPEFVAALRAFRRQALHAERLEFAHPEDGRAVAFEAEPPADMEALLAALREDARAHAG